MNHSFVWAYIRRDLPISLYGGFSMHFEFDDRCGVHSRPNHPCAVIRGVGMHASGMVRELSCFLWALKS